MFFEGWNFNLNYIEQSFDSNLESVVRLRYAFILACLAFIALSPLYRSRKSWFDAIAASRMITILRILIFLEIFGDLLLLYFRIRLGSPLTLNQFTSYGNGDSWVYGYGRPLAGIFLIGAGTMGDMHPLARIICILGLIIQIFGDTVSSIQILSYIQQEHTLGAPTGLYPKIYLIIYYYRDIVSFGLCCYILLLNSLFISTVGICNPPFITFQTIAGGDFDRCEIMRQQRQLKKEFDMNYKSIQSLDMNIMNDKNNGENELQNKQTV